MASSWKVAAAAGSAMGYFLLQRIRKRAARTVEEKKTLLVIAGPSGVGKGTLINALRSRYKGRFGFCVSHTTRSIRVKDDVAEVDGVDYHFSDKATMKAQIDAGQFLESAVVHGNLYGTSLAALRVVQQAGKICILDIDKEGVKSVKKLAGEVSAHFIFIEPPSMKALEQRLRDRKTENEAAIQRRLGNAAGEIEYGRTPGNFSHIICNDNLDDTVAQFVVIIRQLYPHLPEPSH